MTAIFLAIVTAADYRGVVELYLMRHGEAQAEGSDAQRRLTDRGTREVTAIAEFLGGLAGRPAEIRHSGKRRAEQTARIVAESIGLGQHVVAVDGLGANDDVETMAELLAAEPQSVMLVGHLPYLSRLASLLVLGDPERELVVFGTAVILCLARINGGWRISWMITPRIVKSGPE
jgi:phosphohistidine phosphatase